MRTTPEGIRVIFLDLGNTLRILVKDKTHIAAARRRMAELAETSDSPDAFCEKVDRRYETYRKWAFENLREAPEVELWTRWLAPELPAARIAPVSVHLTYQYRQSKGRRVLVAHGREVVDELDRRGYMLGVISNVITSREIPDWIEADGFAEYFRAVVLSSTFGRRKPDPAIYLEAARLAGVDPSMCAYVGDNLKRDVTGAREAGFGMVIIMTSSAELDQETITDRNRPDVMIERFEELLDIFPAPAEATTGP